MVGMNPKPKQIQLVPIPEHAPSDEIEPASKFRGQSPLSDLPQNSETQQLERDTDGFIEGGTRNRIHHILGDENLRFEGLREPADSIISIPEGAKSLDSGETSIIQQAEGNLESQSTQTHQVYKSKADIPWEHVDYLGKGAFGWVEKVKQKGDSLGTALYARKTIQNSSWNALQNLASIQNEVSIIQKLRHRHMVRLVSTYQVEKQFCLVMLPAAQCHLGEYLEMLSNTGNGADIAAGHRLIWKWYGCLSQALKYIHQQRIRHK
jgi:hypothetical protein